MGVVFALLVSGIALVGGASPASAAYSYMCRTYDSCNSAGYSHYDYKSKKGTMYWNMASGNNCTNYVAYRYAARTYDKITGRPWSGDGDAYNWGLLNASKTNSTPKVGATAWWNKNVAPAYGFGHVAYVERVVSSSEIWVSESNYGAPGNNLAEFGWIKVTKSGGGWPSGFVHFGDEKLRATTEPSVSGTAAVGKTLTAKVGTWRTSSNKAPYSPAYAYQWLADGANISGATGATLALSTSHHGKKISVKVTASSPGMTAVASTSSATGAVAAGTFSISPAATISGTAKVGSTLTANRGTWSPAPTTYTYQWLANDVAVAGATSATYVPGPSDVGKRMKVKVSGTRTGYTTASSTSASSAVVATGGFSVSPGATISGTAKVGSTLTADTGTWKPTPAAFGYEWFADDVAIAGAASATYVPGTSEVGKRITVSVTGTGTGYAATSSISAASEPVALGDNAVLSAPGLTDQPKVGAPVGVHLGSWSVTPQAVVYQWTRDGAPIADATAAEYVPTPEDVSTTLGVTVTVSAAGYNTATADAPALSVAHGVLVATRVPSVKGKLKSGKALRAVPGTWSAPVTISWNWSLLNGKKAKTLKVSGSKLKLKRGWVGKRVRLVVTISAPGYVPTEITLTPKGKIKKGKVKKSKKRRNR